MKINIGISFANRVLKLSDPQFHQKNFKLIQKILLQNNYPMKIIFRIINKSKHTQSSPQQASSNDMKIYRSFPYVPMLTDSITTNIKKFNPNINFGIRPLKKLKHHIFTNAKTKVQRKRQGHVYKIQCKGNTNQSCHFSYIGESGRSASNIKTNYVGQRIKEHIADYKSELKKQQPIQEARLKQYNDLQKNKTRNASKQLQELQKQHQEEDKNRTYKTAILSHAFHNNHTFEFSNPTTLHRENNSRRRKALESAYIHKEGFYACNDKQDTQFLHSHVKQVINAYTYSNQ